MVEVVVGGIGVVGTERHRAYDSVEVPVEPSLQAKPFPVAVNERLAHTSPVFIGTPQK